MSQRLRGRSAIVTGSSSGIGRAIAMAYAREGASVMCTDLQETAGGLKAEEATHKMILAAGGKAAFVKTDVTVEAETEALIAATVQHFGRLDILVNNAGVCYEIQQLANQPGGIRLHEASKEIFEKSLSINVAGMFSCCKYALKQFLTQEPLPPNSRGDATRGWIVNMSSIAGVVGFPGAPSYCASKHAVVGMTKDIALSYAQDRVHCNAICPGFVETPLIAPITKDKESPIAVGTTAAVVAAHPWNALGTVEDVASAAIFLASEDSQWVTGTTLLVDGGYTAR